MDDWRQRLLAAADKDGRSDRKLSLDAGLGPNFVNELRTSQKEPGVNKVLRLASMLNVSAAYLFTGADISGADEALLVAFLRLSPDNRSALLKIARQLREASPA